MIQNFSTQRFNVVRERKEKKVGRIQQNPTLDKAVGELQTQHLYVPPWGRAASFHFLLAGY